MKVNKKETTKLLKKRVILRPPIMRDFEFARFITSNFMIKGKVYIATYELKFVEEL